MPGNSWESHLSCFLLNSTFSVELQHRSSSPLHHDLLQPMTSSTLFYFFFWQFFIKTPIKMSIITHKPLQGGRRPPRVLSKCTFRDAEPSTSEVHCTLCTVHCALCTVHCEHRQDRKEPQPRPLLWPRLMGTPFHCNRFTSLNLNGIKSRKKYKI